MGKEGREPTKESSRRVVILGTGCTSIDILDVVGNPARFLHKTHNEKK